MSCQFRRCGCRYRDIIVACPDIGGFRGAAATFSIRQQFRQKKHCEHGGARGKSHNRGRYRTAANCSNTTVELKRDVGNVELHHHYHDSICHGIAKTEWKGFARAGQGRTEPYGGGAVHR